MFGLTGQTGFSCGHGFVQAPDLGLGGGLQQQIRIVFSLLDNLPQGFDKAIEILLGFRFCGLHHQRALDHKRKIDGGWMKTVVYQSLGNVEGAYLICLLIFVRKDTFMHTGPVIGQMKNIPEAFFQIIGVQYSQLTCCFQLIAHGKNVGISPNLNPEITVKCVNFANGFREIIRKFIPVVDMDYPGHRQKRFELFCDANRSAARASSTMGGRKCFVEVEVQYIHTEVRHVNHTHHGVHIGAVCIYQAASGMYDVRYLFDIFFKKTQCVRVNYRSYNRLCYFFDLVVFCDLLYRPFDLAVFCDLLCCPYDLAVFCDRLDFLIRE